MNLNEEMWVEEVLQSTKGISRAQAPDNLKQKIEAKLTAPRAKIITIKSLEFKWLAAAVILLIGLNIVLLTQQHKKASGFNRGNQNNDYSFGSNDLIKL
jgi:hypothetical protein